MELLKAQAKQLISSVNTIPWKVGAIRLGETVQVEFLLLIGIESLLL